MPRFPLVLLLLPGLAWAEPLEPVLVSPVQDAVVSSTVLLEARVEDSEGALLEVDFHLRSAAPAEAWEPFTVVALPDTQFLVYEQAGAHVEVFEAQTRWIVEQRDVEDIAFATHLGDVVQTWDDTTQWVLAEGAMSTLDGELPYGIALGNHDCDFPRGEGGDDPACIFDEWFPLERYEAEPWWGGDQSWEGGYSSYQLISASGLDLLMLHLAFEPREEELAWAAEVIDAHPDHIVILSTHWFLDPEGEWAGSGPHSSDGIWEALVAPFDNVWLVLSAHVPGESRRSDEVGGHPVHQLLSCYQTVDDRVSLDGWMRLMRFEPALGLLTVETYSPVLDSYETDEDSEFVLDLPVLPYDLDGVSDVASGDVAQLSWEALEPGSYEWYVVARDDAGAEAASVLGGFEVEAGGEDTGLGGDSGDSGEEPEDTGEPDDTGGGGTKDGCGGCAGAEGLPGVLWLLGLVGAWVRRGRASIS